MPDYTHLYREELSQTEAWRCEWDILISAFNESERVKIVYENARAKEKYWIVHEEYGYEASELSLDDYFVCKALTEEAILDFWEARIARRYSSLSGCNICVDATGFMRPHLMFLIGMLESNGLKKLDVLYSEPKYYRRRDLTMFSDAYVEDVRQVVGFEGSSDSAGVRDVLIIGAGYETHLIAEVAEDKDQAEKVVLLGLPSLQADMYHQNAWRAWQAGDAIEPDTCERYFAPAADPFATATVVSELVEKERAREPVRHFYLAPLSTKAQAVGFALCYLKEYRASNVSILYPFTKNYARETSVGVSRIWKHTLEF